MSKHEEEDSYLGGVLFRANNPYLQEGEDWEHVGDYQHYLKNKNKGYFWQNKLYNLLVQSFPSKSLRFGGIKNLGFGGIWRDHHYPFIYSPFLYLSIQTKEGYLLSFPFPPLPLMNCNPNG